MKVRLPGAALFPFVLALTADTDLSRGGSALVLEGERHQRHPSCSICCRAAVVERLLQTAAFWCVLHACQATCWPEQVLVAAYADEHGHLSLPARLTCGALAGMTGTALTHPLDTVRLRLALPNSVRFASHRAALCCE